MTDSLERLIDEEESKVILALVNRVHSLKQEDDSCSNLNILTDTVISPVYSSEQSSQREWSHEDAFPWYEGDRKNGVPDGQGKEYRDVNGKRVLLFQGTFKNGKKVKGNKFLNNGLFYTCEYRDERPFASGWDESTKKRIDKLIASKPDSQARDMTGTSFVELYHQNEDSRPIHVFTGYVTQQWKCVLGMVYTDDDENNPLYEGFFDAEGKYDGYGTYFDHLHSFTGSFSHGVPKSGQLFTNSTLVYAGEVDEEYKMEGSGVLYYPVRNNSGAKYVKYEGAFKSGVFCGFGKLFAKGVTERGELEYCGYFKDGMFDGKGIMVAKDKLVMCWNPRVTLAGLVECSREEFDRIPSVGEWADGKPKKGYKFLTNGEPCSVVVENGVVEIENYVNEKGEAISGYGVEATDENGDNVLDLGFMKVVWNGNVSVKSVKRENGEEVTVEKRFRMSNGRQEGEVSFRVNGVLVFKGCCVECVPNGEGTMTGQNGESVKGEWRKGELVKGTIRVYRNGQWRTYTMDSMTAPFQYLGGFAQPISGKGNMTVGTRTSSGTFENGEMVMGAEYIESTKQGVKWGVRYVFVVNGEKATLRYSVLDNDEKVYDSLMYGSCSIVSKGNGIVEVAFEKEGKKVTKAYQCSQQQLKQVFSEESITMNKRFRDVPMVEENAGRMHRDRHEGVGGNREKTRNSNHVTQIDESDGKRTYQFAKDGNMVIRSTRGNVLYKGGVQRNEKSWWTENTRNTYKNWLYVPNGNGEEYDESRILVYRGGYFRGYRYGRGEEFEKGTKVYEGEFDNDCRHGNGTEFCGKYQLKGTWKNGKKSGVFRMTNKNGFVFESTFVNDENGNEWRVYDQKTLLYKGSLKNFLPEKGEFYVLLDGNKYSVSTDSLKESIVPIGDVKVAYYIGSVSVQRDFCVSLNNGALGIHGRMYGGDFHTINEITDCIVEENGKKVFLGIVRNLQYYAGFRYINDYVEEGLFEKGYLRHGYREDKDGHILRRVGNPSVYETAYKREGMTFRNKRATIKF